MEHIGRKGLEQKIVLADFTMQNPWTVFRAWFWKDGSKLHADSRGSMDWSGNGA